MWTLATGTLPGQTREYQKEVCLFYRRKKKKRGGGGKGRNENNYEERNMDKGGRILSTGCTTFGQVTLQRATVRL